MTTSPTFVQCEKALLIYLADLLSLQVNKNITRREIVKGSKAPKTACVFSLGTSVGYVGDQARGLDTYNASLRVRSDNADEADNLLDKLKSELPMHGFSASNNAEGYSIQVKSIDQNGGTDRAVPLEYLGDTYYFGSVYLKITIVDKIIN